MNTVIRLVVVVALVVAETGCHDSGPTAPNQTPRVPLLTGTVATVTGFTLNAATVEGIDAQGARTSTSTDRAGYYELQVPPAGVVTVRASKIGYVSSEYAVDLPRTAAANFILDFTESLALRGDHTMTLAADPACVQLPADVRTRTYDASLIPLWADYYNGTLRHGTTPVGAFVAVLDGAFASFFANDSDTFVYERLGSSAFLWIDFVVGKAPIDQPSFTLLMTGSFNYCADIGPDHACRVPRTTCDSSNHTFTLTRR